MRVVYHVPVYNDLDWLRPNVEAMLDVVDLVVISEGICGGFKRFRKAQSNRSTDGTDEYLHDLTARNPRVKVVRGNAWTKLEQRCSVEQFLERDDWLLIAGADEFYHLSDIERIRRLAESHPDVWEWVPVLLNFWKDGHTLYYNVHGPRWLTQQRFVRWVPGHGFRGSAETIRDQHNRDRGWHRAWSDRRVYCPDWLQYHYMSLREPPADLFDKHLWYRTRRGGNLTKAVLDALELTAFTFRDRKYGMRRLSFDGDHPEQIADHPLVARRHWQNQSEMPSWRAAVPYNIRTIEQYVKWWTEAKSEPQSPVLLDGKVVRA